MTPAELQEYIKTTEEAIVQLLDDYSALNKEKLAKIRQLDNMKKRAYELKELFQHISWSNDKININNNISLNITTKPKRGEIWTCQLGKNIGSEENKIRPVIIVQNDTGNEKGPTTIIVPISNRPKKIATHIELRENDYKLVPNEEARVTGTILCEQIKVVSKARLGRHVATLENDFIIKILNPKLKISIDL
jgi:mRNA-degrading endonuclease toxin of MazEF toxin-antitoxin module